MEATCGEVGDKIGLEGDNKVKKMSTDNVNVDHLISPRRNERMNYEQNCNKATFGTVEDRKLNSTRGLS